ncbi:ergothioneine biosynthesis protein EgtC [Kitasatospora sp. NPDC051170]|uniref:ergothioneine biosynthesis protein EgtC n=1 Tax=Kitasatospora sp. NPDC051170 TaxID=3364056 RepID=UPI0037B61641
MCRHLAYLGEPLAPQDLLVTPPYALYRQSWAPREQRHGTVNADGFGLGWYADGDEVPARYRRAGPIWADAAFADLARVLRTRALVAAVRSATTGCAAGEAAAAPFAAGPWLFSHNGAVAGWPGDLGALAALLPPEELLALEAHTDSALLWGLTLHRLRAGAPLGEALTGTVADVAAHTTARLNLLLTDGRSIAATAWGDTLYHRTLPGLGTVVASEPYDDRPQDDGPQDDGPHTGRPQADGPRAGDSPWQRTADRSLLLADSGGVTVHPLPGR